MTAYLSKNVTPSSHIQPQNRPSCWSAKAISDSPILLLQPYSTLRNSCTAPWAQDERPREMTALLVISAPGHSHYICWPAGLYARQSPGPRMGRSRGGLVLPGLEENTSTKSLTHPPNSPLSRYITSDVCVLQSSFLNFQPWVFWSRVSYTSIPLLPLVL